MADIYFDGPEPPEGKQWCSVCAMLAKQRTVHARQAMVQQAARTGDDAPAVRVSMALDGAELKPAVTHAISTVVPQFGSLPLCWSHVLGLELLPGGVAPASPQEAAMFGQAAQLNSGRRP
jgi:hypothetical protein